MQLLRYIISMGVVLLVTAACNPKENPPTKNAASSVIQTEKKTEASVVENKKPAADKELSVEACVALLDSLVRTSSFDASFRKNGFENYQVIVEKATIKKVIIKITDVAPNETPLSWLVLNLNEEKLYDITKDDLNPELLTIDKAILNKFQKNCLKHCLD